MRNQRGITLIALVITIIVLLILAGVSIAMLTGDNGILSNATRSVSETNIAEDREAAILALSDAYSDYLEAKYVNTPATTDTFIQFLTTNAATYLNDPDHFTYTTTSGVVITTKSTNAEGKQEFATVDTDGGITDTGWTPATSTSNPSDVSGTTGG